MTAIKKVSATLQGSALKYINQNPVFLKVRSINI